VVKRLEGIVQLADEGMRDFALNFFLGNNKFNQTIISLLFHSFKRVEIVRTQVLHQEDLSIRALPQHPYPFKVLCLHLASVRCVQSVDQILDVVDHLGVVIQLSIF
jgi:hypothetical protein